MGCISLWGNVVVVILFIPVFLLIMAFFFFLTMVGLTVSLRTNQAVRANRGVRSGYRASPVGTSRSPTLTCDVADGRVWVSC